MDFWNLSGDTLVTVGKSFFQTVFPFADVVSGVPQGSVTRQLLFLLFIKPHQLYSMTVFQSFADDIKLLLNSAAFRDDLMRVLNWNLANGIQANASKTTTVFFKGYIFVESEIGFLENVRTKN